MTSLLRKNFKSWKPPKIKHGVPTKWNWVVLHPENLKLGKHTDIGAFTLLAAHHGIEIEDEVQIGSHCAIYSASTIDDKIGKVTLKKNCRIGTHSSVMPGVTIGENTVVGAHSFVNKDLPANVVAVGCPALILKKLLLTIFFFFPLFAFGASPTVIGTNTVVQDAVAGTSYTFSHTVPTGGENTALVVMNAVSSANITGITWNGTAMTKLGATMLASYRQPMAVFFLAAPEAGTYNIVVSLNESRTNKNAVAFTLQDVVQSSPEDVRAQNASASATSLTTDITTTVNSDLMLVQISTNATSNYVPDAGQTSLGTIGGVTDELAWSYQASPTATTENVGYSWTTASGADIMAIALKYVAPTPAPSSKKKVPDIISFW